MVKSKPIAGVQFQSNGRYVKFFYVDGQEEMFYPEFYLAMDASQLEYFEQAAPQAFAAFKERAVEDYDSYVA